MATGAELAEIVLHIVQDDSYDEDYVLYQLNQCAQYLSGEFVLPGLDKQGTITTKTDAWNVATPSDFQRNLYAANDSSGRPIGILSNRKEMLSYSGGDISRAATRIERIAVIGDQVVYWPINTTAETLTLFYQRKPTTITLGGEVSLLPGAFSGNDQLFIDFACWKLFERIEQGLEGQKIDTNHHMALFFGMLDKLGSYLNKESGQSLPGPKVVRMVRW